MNITIDRKGFQLEQSHKELPPTSLALADEVKVVIFRDLENIVLLARPSLSPTQQY